MINDKQEAVFQIKLIVMSIRFLQIAISLTLKIYLLKLLPST